MAFVCLVHMCEVLVSLSSYLQNTSISVIVEPKLVLVFILPKLQVLDIYVPFIFNIKLRIRICFFSISL